MGFRNFADSVGIVNTTVFTCPASYEAVLHSLFLSNNDPDNGILIDISVQFVHIGASVVYVAKGVIIPPGTALEFDKSINFRSGDLLILKASAPTCDCVGSLLLTPEDTLAP